MRLTHVLLRNCRLHSQLRHDFSPGLNLVCGLNETGKSTLVESMHRALFLRAKGNTEAHRALVPSTGGSPEVELAFESGGRRFVLRKRFGSNGTTTLSPHDSLQISGEAAEKELERIVGPSASGGELRNRWAHLWVWQGESGKDPTEHATLQRDLLLSRLQTLGGAAVIQSATDTRLTARFAEEAGRWFGAHGKARADSPLGHALKALESAKNGLCGAEDRWRRLETAFRDHEAAIQAVELATRALAELEAEESKNDVVIRKVDSLRVREPVEAAMEREARARWEKVREADHKISQLSESIAQLQRDAMPRILRVDEVRQTAQVARDRLKAAEAELQVAEARVRTGRLAEDLASAQMEKLQLAARREAAQAQRARIELLQSQVAANTTALASLPLVDATVLRRLRELESAIREAKASLTAMAAEITVVDSDRSPVFVGGSVLAAGHSATVTESTIIQIGGVRLRLKPGGGSALDDTRAKAARLDGELLAKLAALGLQRLPDAEEVATRRDAIERDSKGLRGRLGELAPDQAGEDEASITTRLAEIEARISRLAPLVEPVTAPVDVEEARRRQMQRKLEVETLEGDLRRARQARENSNRQRNELDEHERDLARENEEKGRGLEALRGQLQMLVAEYGDSVVRAQQLEKARFELEAALACQRNTREAIEALQPELHAADRVRLAQVRQDQARALSDARERAAAAKMAMRTDGLADPKAELAAARMARDRAQEVFNGFQLHASAIVLLDDLFKEEQQKLSVSFTRPLADRLNGYLRCIFGPKAEAQVDYREGEFQGLRLLRPDESPAPMAFDSLSGGTREQVAAALRFAVAELLAADGDGSLPVVLDDAFAYSDPDRVRGMIRMLDHARRRGLQVILLTCNPAIYQSLGARPLTLQKPLAAASRPPNAPGSPTLPSTFQSEAPDAGDTSEASNSAPTMVDAPTEMDGERDAKLLEALVQLGGSSGNQSLREALGWSNHDYEITKRRLVDQGRLVPGRGRGGSVALTPR